MRILLTGCSGFIGSALINVLLEQEHKVFCISKSMNCFYAGKSTHICHDLSEPLNYKDFPDCLDCIIHLAASMDKNMLAYDMFKINTASTLDLLEYGKKTKIKKFIYVSSGAVYGYSDLPLTEESPAIPFDLYGLSKYQSELLFEFYKENFSYAILRLFFCYGAGQKRGIIPWLAGTIQNKQQVTIFNECNPRINPIHIVDLVSSIYNSLILEGHHTFNICGDETVNIKTLSLMIGSYLNIEPIFVNAKNNKISDLVGVSERAKKLLGLRTTITLKQGIKDYLEYLKSSIQNKTQVQ